MEIKHREFLKSFTTTCHASTMAFYKGKPIYAWFGGSREGMPDCSIYIQGFGKTYDIGRQDQLPRWNPILYQYKSKLFLFVKVGVFCDRWQTLIYDISKIDKECFDINKVNPYVLPSGLNGPVKTKPIIHNNKICCGSSFETIMDWTSYIEEYEVKDSKFVFLDRSKPLIVPKQVYKDYYGNSRMANGIIQPALWVDKYNVLHSFFRSSHGLNKIYYSNSKEGVWADPIPTNFENPNSGVDVVYTQDKLFLAYNPYSSSRIPLVVAELDDQFNVKETLVVRDGIDEKDVTYSIELSYPYLIENNGSLCLTYTYGRSKIEYVEILI